MNLDDLMISAEQRSARLKFSSHLYSRGAEQADLLSAFEHVSRTGSHALVIISGPSGIGKSALLNAFADQLQDRDASVATGKVNQTLRNTPYSALIDAFRSLVLQILHEPEENRHFWKRRLSSMLGLHSALAVNVIPELAALLENSAVGAPCLIHSSEIQFQGLIHHLVSIFSVADRPLVLLLDDIHWIDAGTARVLEYMLGTSAGLPLLLVLARRVESTEASFGGTTVLSLLRQRSTHSQEIRLDCLSLLALEAFLADTFKSFQTNLREVADLVHQKSKGNPFFVRQLLNSIADEGLMWFNHKDLAWQFDLARIRALEYTDNIAELMLSRLARLPHVTQTILAHLAALGKDVELMALAEIVHQDKATLQALLQEAIEAELVVLKPQGYGFFHDRVQEAAQAMISPQARSALHLRVAKLILRNPSVLERDDEVFQVADHLAQGINAVTDTSSALDFAKLALLASQRAKRATAYAFALTYIDTGAAYLELSCDANNSEIKFALGLERAECEFLLGNVQRAGQLSKQLIASQPRQIELAAIYRLQAEIDQRKSDHWQAIEKALAGLRLLHIEIPRLPSEPECHIAYVAVRRTLGDDPQLRIEQLPPMDNAEIQTTVSLLSVLRSSAAVTSDGLHFLVLCQLLGLHLEHGYTTHFPCALGWFGVQVAHRFAHVEDGFSYAELARELAVGCRHVGNVARAILPLEQVSVWTRPLQFAMDQAREGFKLAAANADVTIACHASCDLISTMLAQNSSLVEVGAEITRALQFAQQVSLQDAEDILQLQKKFVNSLCHEESPQTSLTPQPLLSGIADSRVVQPLSSLMFQACLYAAIGHFHAEEFDSARKYIDLSAELTWSVPAQINLLDFHFFAALIHSVGEVAPNEQALKRHKLIAHHAVIARWATTNPITFSDKEAIIRAEILRLEGDFPAALSALEQAIAHASEYGFLHYLGVAHQLAARLTQTLGYRTAANAHLRAAHAAFVQWGALALAQQLERRNSGLLNSTLTRLPQQVSGQANEHQADERGFEELRYITAGLTTRDVVRRLLLSAMGCLGAGKGVFISCDGTVRQVEALAKTTVYGMSVEEVARPVTEDDMPQAVLKQTIKTRQYVAVESLGSYRFNDLRGVLNDSVRFSAFSIPVHRDDRLAGILYVENFSLNGAFCCDDLQLIQRLVLHAAVVLRNAAHYDALMIENAEHRKIESELRSSQSSLVLGEQFSHTGSMRWIIQADRMDCSAELCRIYALPPGKTSLNFAEFMEIIHPDDRVSVAFVIHEAVPVGGTIRVEHRICRPDGTIRYVAGIGKPIYVNGVIEEYVGSATDVTVRRQSEDALRIAQADLARVSRAITVGQLTASIAHEINQPLMSIVSNAGASLRWLERDPADLGMAILGLKDIAAEGKRAGDIIKGLQSLTRNSEPVFERIDLHTMLRHVLAISRGEFERNCISVDLDLAATHSALMGDSVQIQQVLLNLVVNAIEAMAEINDRPRILSMSTANPDDSTLLVKVKDTGSGIAATQLEKVFDAFYTTKKNGMGMGLAICRSIVEAHHGSLHVSVRDPYGLEFYFGLPLASAPPAESA